MTRGMITKGQAGTGEPCLRASCLAPRWRNGRSKFRDGSGHGARCGMDLTWLHACAPFRGPGEEHQGEKNKEVALDTQFLTTVGDRLTGPVASRPLRSFNSLAGAPNLKPKQVKTPKQRMQSSLKHGMSGIYSWESYHLSTTWASQDLGFL